MGVAGNGLWRTGLALVAGLAALSIAACADNDVEQPPTPTAAVTEVRTPTPAELLPAGNPGVTVANVIQACREKDGDRLRSFVAGAVLEEEVRALFARGTDVRLVSQTPPRAEDGRATAVVRLEVRRDGEIEFVERTWELEQGADGVWRLTALPDCF